MSCWSSMVGRRNTGKTLSTAGHSLISRGDNWLQRSGCIAVLLKPQNVNAGN